MMPGSRVTIPNGGDFIVSADGSLVPVGNAQSNGGGFGFNQQPNRGMANNDFVFGSVRRR